MTVRLPPIAVALVALATLLVAASPAAAAPSARAADRDCADFSDQAAAQRYFVERGGPGADPDRLDGDGDGVACQSLPCPCSTDGGPPQTEPEPKPKLKPGPARRIRATLVRVIDGDTLVVRRRGSSRRETVRLIGVDTPETKRPGVAVECGGPQASQSMVGLAPVGARLLLRTDPSQDLRDRYDRLLAYVGRRGRDLGRIQVARGWAEVYVYRARRFRRTAAYRRAARQARRARRGVHRRCGGDFHSERSSAVSAGLAHRFAHFGDGSLTLL